MGAAIRLFPAAECLLALMAGIAAFRFGGLSSFSLLALTVAALLAILLSRMRTAGRALLPLFAAAGFALLASAAAAFEAPAHVANNVPAKGELVGTVAGGFEYFSPAACRFVLEAKSLDGRTVAGGVQVSLREASRLPLPGETVRIANARLKPVTGMRNIGGFDYAAYMRDAGVGARLSARGADLAVAAPAPVWHPLAAGERLRRAMLHYIGGHFPPRQAAAAAAMSIGVTGGLGRQERRAYTVAGIAHLFSVSGLHVGFISGIAYAAFDLLFFNLCWLFRRDWAEAGRHRQAAALAALGAVALFVVTAGMKVAAVRAGIMAAAFFLAIALRRENRLLNALALAALATLLYDPAALFSISFILSYGAMAAIIAVLAGREPQTDEPLRRAAGGGFWARRKKELLLTLKISAGIMLALAPVMMSVFNEVHGAGVLANIVALPLGAVAVPGAFAAACVAYFLPFAADAAGWTAALPVVALDAVARLFAAHPLLSFAGPAPAAWLTLLFYAALIPIFFARREAAIAAAVICAGAVAVHYWPSPRAHAEFRFIDVGQGDASLILFSNGATVLVDGGPAFGNYDAGELALIPELRRLGVRRLDAVIATHGDMDHVGGLFAVLRGVPVEAYYDNSGDEKMLLALRAAAAARGAAVGRLAAGDRLAFGAEGLAVLHPTPAFFGAVKEHKDNNRSLVIMATAGGRRLLLPGDAEKAAERALLDAGAPVGADLLHVAHHGSRSSTARPFAEAVGARVAVISAGPGNAFHFPARATLETLAAQGSVILRTDRMGEVVLRPAPEGFYLRTWAAPQERLIPLP